METFALEPFILCKLLGTNRQPVLNSFMVRIRILELQIWITRLLFQTLNFNFSLHFTSIFAPLLLHQGATLC